MAFDFAALAQKGKLFYGGHTVGLAPVTAIPTTTATIALVNTNGDGGESLIIKSVSSYLVSGTPTASGSILCGVSVGKIASLPTAHMTNTYSAPTRGKVAPSNAFFQASTLPATAVWMQLQNATMLAAATVGQGPYGAPADVNGAFIVPPGYAFHLAMFSGTGTTPLFGWSLVWGEAVVTFP
jgi:hypothetical protein